MSPALLAPEPGPDTLVEVRWGGRRLAALRGVEPRRAIGESWEFSTLPGRESRAGGRALSEVLGRTLPFLAKLIDTRLALSVQVHPKDEPQHGQLGKEEAWVILEADVDAAVHVGTRPGVTLGQLADAARVPQPERLLGLLNRVPAKPGTVVLVPAGAVHAIGGGILLAEIQQPTDRTYRLYDYGSARELHVEAALGASDVEAQPQIWELGDLVRRLRGDHVELRILEPGEHSLEEARDWLVIPALGEVALSAAGLRESLAPAQLRLCAGGPAALRVGPSGLCVVGTVH